MSLLQQLTTGATKIEATQIKFNQLDQIIPLVRQQTQLQAITLGPARMIFSRWVAPTHPQEIRQILAALQDLPRLHTITLGISQIGHLGGRALAPLASRLTYLDLSCNRLGHRGWRELIDGIPLYQPGRPLLTLILKECDFLDEDLIYLTKAMLGIPRGGSGTRSRTLQELRTKPLPFLNPPIGIRHLDLSQNTLKDLGWTISLILQYNTLLQTLVLGNHYSHFGYGLTGLQHNTTLRVLKLDFPVIGNTRSFCHDLSRNSSLIELDLDRFGNGCGLNEARILGSWLAHHSTLRRLKLFGVAPELFQMLSSGLAVNNFLLDLDLSYGRISGAAADWPLLGRLQTLNLTGVPIETPLLQRLFELLSINAPLISLTIPEAQASHDFYLMMCSALTINTNLRKLAIGYISTPPSPLNLMNTVLMQNSTLEELNLRCATGGPAWIQYPLSDQLDRNRHNRIRRSVTFFQILLALYYDLL